MPQASPAAVRLPHNRRMSTPDTRKALWQIHFCVLLWGVTAILGKLITLPALPLVWWRMLLVTAMLALLPRVWRGLRTLPVRLVAGYAGIGALVALHWLTFYGAVKLANASVAATCIALELGVGSLTLTLLAPLMPYLLPALASPLWVVPDLHDGILLLVLAGFCTLLPFALALVALRHLSAYTVQLVTNLEPVYAVVLAVVLLREQHEVTPWFYLGVAIIVGAVFLHPLLNRRKPVQHPEILGTAEARNIAD